MVGRLYPYPAAQVNKPLENHETPPSSGKQTNPGNSDQEAPASSSSGTGTTGIDDRAMTFTGDPPGTAAVSTAGTQRFTPTHRRLALIHRLKSLITS